MFKNPFSFEGRIRRLEYGITFIIYVFTYFLFMILSSSANEMAAVIILLLLVPVLWLLYAQGAKRCHDIGKSGWWQLIPFYFLVMIFQDGDPGRNEYGYNSKGIVGPNDHLYVDTRSEALDSHLR